jgi:3-oxoacyl-[acyl-carrier-protein] synthase II
MTTLDTAMALAAQTTLSPSDICPTGIDFVANQARPMEMDYAISNGFGFGGVNASALFRRWTDKSATEVVGGIP